MYKKSNTLFEENLPSGGKLQISSDSWKIQYYFSGPDLRYNGTFKSVPGNEIDKYISAWKNNFNEYKKIKGQFPAGCEVSKPGECGMTIRAGSYREGVCLISYHMNIKDEDKLNEIINDYEYAKKRAREMQAILKGKIIPKDSDKPDDDFIIDALYSGIDIFEIGEEMNLSFKELKEILNRLSKYGYIKNYSFKIEWAKPLDPKRKDK